MTIDKAWHLANKMPKNFALDQMVTTITKLIKPNPLFFAFFFPALTDAVVTLIGQGKNYLQNPATATDASPAYYFLVASPWLFISGSVIWFIFWYWLIKKLKEPLNLFFMFFFISAHSWGSSSWIIKMLGKSSYILLIIYFSLISLIATFCFKIYERNKHD